MGLGNTVFRNKIKIFKNDTILDIFILLILALIIVYSFNIDIFGLMG